MNMLSLSICTQRPLDAEMRSRLPSLGNLITGAEMIGKLDDTIDLSRMMANIGSTLQSLSW